MHVPFAQIHTQHPKLGIASSHQTFGLSLKLHPIELLIQGHMKIVVIEVDVMDSNILYEQISNLEVNRLSPNHSR